MNMDMAPSAERGLGVGLGEGIGENVEKAGGYDRLEKGGAYETNKGAAGVAFRPKSGQRNIGDVFGNYSSAYGGAAV